MLSAATLHLIDRLVAALMTLVEAVAPSLAPSSNPSLPTAAAHTLLSRLSNLVVRLIGISNFGVPTPRKPEPTPQAPNPPAPRARPTQPRDGDSAGHSAAPSLPRRRGWLLAALPEIAPPVAAEIGALLADPAIAHLLDLAPSLRRALRPLLRALGLEAPTSIPTPPPPSSSTTPPDAPPPNPTPAPPHHPPLPAPAPKLALPNTQPLHVLFVAVS